MLKVFGRRRAVTTQLVIPADGGARFEDGPDRGRVLVFGHDTGGRYSLMEFEA